MSSTTAPGRGIVVPGFVGMAGRTLRTVLMLPVIAALGVVTVVWAVCCPRDLPLRFDDD